MDQSTEPRPATDTGAPAPPKPFILGLTMAGAVSAGAYSAGVLDFLFEALGEWQAAKDRRTPGVPQHDVVIAAMSGASAGGISGAISLLSLAGGLRPGYEPRSPSTGPGAKASLAIDQANLGADRGIRRVLPELYDAWVTGPRLFGRMSGANGNGAFLDHGDLGKDAQFGSLLDSGPLQQVAERVLKNIRPLGPRYRFVTNPVHLFLTVTNLDGIPYVIPFDGGGHVMTSHADCVHYAMKGLGVPPFPAADCQWLSNWGDEGVPIDLTRPLDPAGKEGHAFIQAVLATSAFPFALRPREIVRPSTAFSQRAWPIEEEDREKHTILPNWPAGTDPSKPFDTYCVAVDGGATDNQPFEYAHWAIRDLNEDRNNRDPKLADRAVIMIDPFGAPKPYDVGGISKPRQGDLILTHVLKTFVPALTNQARFKIDDLLHANDPDSYSRFLISPSRSFNHKRIEPALASGLLEAFGGFLDQRFREHDFELGRRNCQRFLKVHFVLHKDNALFRDNNWQPLDAGDRTAPGDADLRPIIPLMPSVAAPIADPDWPRIEPERLNDLQHALAARLDTIAYKLINDSIPVAFWNWVARVIWRRLKRDDVVAYLRAVVETTLLRGQQIVIPAGSTGTLPLPTTPQQFGVLAALTDPGWDLRTAQGIADEYNRMAGHENVQSRSGVTPLDEAQVGTILKSLGPMVVQHRRGHGKPLAYTLRTRQPRLASAWTRWLRYNARLKCDDDKRVAKTV